MDTGCDRPENLGGGGSGGEDGKAPDITLTRDKETAKVTYGALSCEKIQTLELPWRDNKRKRSRIPAGVYRCTLDKKINRIRVHDVPGRDGIQVHIGNYSADTTGCILVGMVRRADEDAIWYSAAAMQLLFTYLKENNLESGFTLEVKECFCQQVTKLPS